MAGTMSEESSGGRSLEGLSSGQRFQSGDALAEWRSCEQLEIGTPSTSPPYWDTDDSDDDGLKPSELYGKHTWKIEKFSQINKRELRSNSFEVGGYKWYILIYPQGCDVSNHLSLFLCVANHDKLLPGWSHFAQFTIAVVNKDPGKSKYSDTLHRFWKKEHDWGWKKFMELSKVSDGFVDSDALIIKAQVQVIREKADHPFRCLDCQYRQELVRVYLTNVEQICRRFVEDRRGKLGKLLEDSDKWSSFCSFWQGIDQNARRRMSREKMDLILKVIVKHFFIEKEVTSTLVMDSLYSGLKALEGQSKCEKGKGKSVEGHGIPAPVVWVEKDMFVLVDDVLLLLERAAMQPLPPKDEKGPQNRTKDGSTGEDFNKDSIERDERRLTELGRRTVEIFVLAHIFSNKIEAAYQEAVALKRQEELIREEKAESEQKAKRGMAEKEKKSRKKQKAKQKCNRKAKDNKAKDEKLYVVGVEDRQLRENLTEDGKDMVGRRNMVEKDNTLEDVSDVSDSVDCSADNIQPDSEDRDVSPINWDTDVSDMHLTMDVNCMEASSGILTAQNGVDKRSLLVMGDSSSTCSTDSTPSIGTNGTYRGNSFKNNNRSQKSPTRVKNHQSKMKSREANGTNGVDSRRSDSVVELGQRGDSSLGDKAAETSGSDAVVLSLQEPVKQQEQNIVKKEEEVVVLQRKRSNKNQVESNRQFKEKASVVLYSPHSPPSNTTTTVQPKSNAITADLTPRKTLSSNSIQQQTVKPTVSMNVPRAVTNSPDSVRAALSRPTEKPSSGQEAAPPPTLVSRPSSAPIVHGPKLANIPVVSMAPTVQTPVLYRSVSATGQLGSDPSPSSSAHGFVTQSYRNAIVGSNLVGGASSSRFSHPPSPSPSSTVNQLTTPSSPSPSASPSPSPSPSPPFSQQPALAPSTLFVPRNADRVELGSVCSRISFGASAGQSGGRQQWKESPQRDASTIRSITFDPKLTILGNEISNLDMYTPPISTPGSHSYELFHSDFSVSTSGRPVAQQGVGLADEFPHLDIINELLDDEQGLGSGLTSLPNHRFPNYPSEMGVSALGLSGDLGPSRLGSCRFEKNRTCHDDLFRPDQYASLLGNHYDALGDFIPQGSTIMPCMNGQIDGLVPNQWQVAGTNLSLPSMSSGGGGGDAYPYGIPEYSNLACGLNGYTLFRPSSGH